MLVLTASLMVSMLLVPQISRKDRPLSMTRYVFPSLLVPRPMMTQEFARSAIAFP